MNAALGKLTDALASCAVIVASGVVVWVSLSGRQVVVQETRPPRADSKPARTELRVPSTPLTLTGAPILGNRQAPVISIVYSDFECPFCARFARETMGALSQEIDRGRLQIAYRHFPLDKIHPQARPAAIASYCAGQQDHFWPFHDMLFAREGRLSSDNVERAVEKLGLDRSRFATCIASGQAAKAVSTDAAIGAAIGVSGTPVSFWGIREPDGRVKVSKVLSGASTPDQVKQLVSSLLATLSQ